MKILDLRPRSVRYISSLWNSGSHNRGKLAEVPHSQNPLEKLAAWIVDETDRMRLADQLSQAEKIASLGTLAGGVAHHFNNILGGVATFVDFALTSGDVVSMKRALQMTAEAAARASKITQSLLSFAEVDSRRSDLADLTEVVLTFAHLVERTAQIVWGARLLGDLAPLPKETRDRFAPIYKAMRQR